jgi:hypothetical protein
MDVPRALASKAGQHCVLHLRAEDAGRALTVCRALRDYWASEELWEILVCREFGLTTAIGPDRSNSTARKAAHAWGTLSVELGVTPKSWGRWVDGSLYLRFAAAWEIVERWMAENLPDVHGTFQPALSLEDWREMFYDRPSCPAAKSLPLKLFYGRHNGQKKLMGKDFLLGMFGGYSAYNQQVCSAMLELQEGLKVAGEQLVEVARNNPQLGLAALDKEYGHYVMFGSSLQPAVKHLQLYDCARDRVEVCDLGNRNPIRDAAPPGSGLIGWFETFAGRLSGGVFAAKPLIPSRGNLGNSLVQFPHSGPEMTVEVTRGVQCTASSITMGGDEGWAYSIRLRLLGPEHGWTAETRGFESCQLLSRRWQIFDKATGHTETVEGPGVIGFFPLLVENRHRPDMDDEEGAWSDEPTFVYQSCSGRSKGGTFGGTLRFVPGSLKSPTGPEFDVVVKTFTLERPDYVF